MQPECVQFVRIDEKKKKKKKELRNKKQAELTCDKSG